MFSCCKPIFSPSTERPDVPSPSVSGKDLSPTAPALSAEMMRSNSILNRTLAPSSSDKTSPGARSLFEASAHRAASHGSGQGMGMMPDIDHRGIPEKFLNFYVEALRDSNARWASQPRVADLFADNVKMVGQDKTTTVGKAAVLKRLERGVETLIKMAGKEAAVPDFEGFEGPALTEAMTHECKFTLRRGIMKITFVQEFTIFSGKITFLKNSRQ